MQSLTQGKDDDDEQTTICERARLRHPAFVPHPDGFLSPSLKTGGDLTKGTTMRSQSEYTINERKLYDLMHGKHRIDIDRQIRRQDWAMAIVLIAQGVITIVVTYLLVVTW